MAISTFKRKEIKFMLNSSQYEAIMPYIEKYMNPDEYCKNGSEYGVYNLYFDSDDSYLIRESLSKPYYKEKFRIRSYYSPAKPDDLVFLEIKKKIGGVVAKRRVTLTLKDAENYVKYGIKPDSGKYIQNQVFAEIDAFFDRYDISPKNYISYQREAFFGKNDSTFRLTFDRNILSRRNNLSLKYENYGDSVIGSDKRLMEVKISDCIPLWLSDLLSEYGIYKASFSKYGKAYTQFVAEKSKNSEGGVKTYA